ncbi:MAG: UvrD-helicase domain-containing protein [Clostridia bacterium]|nr:UvrD-helicase domain-containing protein [Clostridia bacterium]
MNREELGREYLSLKRKMFDKVYAGLNDRQREAVYTTEGPLLVLAGAGSGKTTVLVRRIAFIVKYGNAYFSNNVPEDIDEALIEDYRAALAELEPAELEQFLPDFASSPAPVWSVLAITFTNKAANEMKSRLAALLYPNEPEEGERRDEVVAGTFHSVCLRMLRRDCGLIGYAPGFTIYDTDDSKRLISNIIKELRINEKVLEAKVCQTIISRAKDRLLGPEEFAAEAKTDREKDSARVYEVYQRRMRESNAMDFDDIIMNTVHLLEENGELLEKYRRRFRYICVDEYQDTNVAQFRLCFLLSAGYRNLMVVGDDDQSIYAFRGATVENILGFDRAFPDAKVIKLEQNYRSTSRILDAANGVISHNSARHGKSLWTDGDTGDKIICAKVNDQNAEARYICTAIEKAVADGAKYSDHAILYRVNAQANSIESVLAKSGMPFRVLGGTRFYDRKEIKDMLAYLCLICNHGDDLRLKRIVNEPKRKIGDAAIEAAAQIAAENGLSLFEAMRRSGEFVYLKNYTAKFVAFTDMICELTELAEKASVSELIERTIVSSGYKQMLVDAGEAEKDRLENLEELVSAGVEYEKRTEEPSLFGFLEEVALVADIDKYDETADAVVLMTIHSAKGLEFEHVFLPGMEDGLFPGMRSIMEPEELDEERRLAYVAITRARKRLTITYTKERLLYGRTGHNPRSRFVDEIPSVCVEQKDETPKNQQHFVYSDRSRPAFAPSYGIRSGYSSPTGGGAPAPKALPKIKAFNVGDRVAHVTFGTGTVTGVTPMGGDVLYDVEFDTAGHKRLMGSYAKLTASV